jgi:hypothetical protein
MFMHLRQAYSTATYEVAIGLGMRMHSMSSLLMIVAISAPGQPGVVCRLEISGLYM